MKEQLELKPQDERKGGTSASSAQADQLCPGRHLAQQGIASTDSDDAAFGRAVHAALASQSPVGLTAEQLSIYESCQEIESSMVQQVFGADTPKLKTFREQRYWVQVKDEKSDTRYLHSGQPDVVHRAGPTLLICEYKSLASQQEDSPLNLQLRDQAVLAARSLVATDVFTCVIQPLVTMSPELCRYDDAALKKAETEMFERVRKSNQPNAPRQAGEMQCKYCRAKQVCPAYLDWAAGALPVPKAESPFYIAFAQWTPEQRTLAAEKLPVLKKLLAEAEDFLKQQLEQDAESVPGYFLKPGAIRSKVKDAEALFTRFVERGGTLDQFMRCVDITKSELEAAVREVTQKKGKALHAELQTLLEGITEDKQNSPSLAKKK